VLLAEMEAFYSRPIAPTRRVALGRLILPCDPAPGYGGILLGGIAARFAPELDDDWTDEVLHLMTELERGRRIAQPRLRHRLQEDRIGLQSCSHRLLGAGEGVEFSFDEHKGTPAQHVLCAVYAAGTVPWAVRTPVMDTVRKGFRWHGGTGPALIGHLSGRSAGLSGVAIGDPVSWAMGVLDLRDDERPTGTAGTTAVVPSRRDVQRAFRDRLRTAHPDHGATDDGAAQRIAELTEARRILLG
jgi:hypothetical protein